MSSPQAVQSPSWIVSLLRITAGGVILLHVLAALFPSALNWGFHHLAFLPEGMRILLPLLMIAVMVPRVQDGVVRVLAIVAERIRENSRNSNLALLIVAFATAVALFWFGSQSTYFLGDGMFVMRGLKNIHTYDDIAKVFINAPLSGFFVWHLHQFLKSSAVDVPTQLAFQFFSIGTGLLMIVLVGLLARNLTDNPIDRILVFCFITFGASIQLFFGYVENYTLALLTGTLFAYLCILSLSGKLHVIFPSLAFGLMVASHFILSIMLPVLIFVYIDRMRSKGAAGSVAALEVVVASLLAVLFTAAVLWICGYSPGEVVAEFGQQGAGGRHYVPLTEKSAGWHAYTMFSLWHALDLVNLYVLLSPFSLIVVSALALSAMWKGSPRRSQMGALGLMTLIGLLFTITFNSDIGMSRDWDLMAIFNTGLWVLAAFSWSSLVPDEVVRRRMMVMMAGVMLVSTFSWVSVNAGEESSTRRFSMLDDERLWGPAAIAYANEELGNFYRDRGEVAAAIPYYREAVGLDSTNSRRWTVLGSAYESLGDEANVIHAYGRAVETGTRMPEVCDQLLRISAKHNRIDEALRALRKGVEGDPRSLPLLYYLGFGLSEYKHEYHEAASYLARALQVNPHFPQAYETLGYCYYKLKKLPEMRSTWGRYLELMPDSASARQIRELMESVD